MDVNDAYSAAIAEQMLRAPEFLYDEETRRRASDLVGDLTDTWDGWEDWGVCYDDEDDDDYILNERYWKAYWAWDGVLEMVVPETWWDIQEEIECKMHRGLRHREPCCN